MTAIAVLPGALHTRAFEREAGRWGIGLSDRLFRFIGSSAIFLAVFAFPFFLVWSHYIHHPVLEDGHTAFRNLVAESRNVPWWLFFLPIAYVLIPIATGTFTAIAVRKRENPRWRVLARILAGRDPAPRAWDDVFESSPAAVIRLRLKRDGRYVGGLFGSSSYASGYREEPEDLLLEEGYEMERDGSFAQSESGDFVPLGSAVLIKREDVDLMEIFYLEEESDDGESD